MELRGYRCEVDGFPPFLYYAKNRSAAKMACARSIIEAWGCKTIVALRNIKRVVLATPYEMKNVAFNREILLTDRLEWKENVIPDRFMAEGVDHLYRVHVSSNNENVWWWRYGRNIGQYGSELSCGLAKLAAQKHHDDLFNVPDNSKIKD